MTCPGALRVRGVWNVDEKVHPIWKAGGLSLGALESALQIVYHGSYSDVHPGTWHDQIRTPGLGSIRAFITGEDLTWKSFEHFGSKTKQNNKQKQNKNPYSQRKLPLD